MYVLFIPNWYLIFFKFKSLCCISISFLLEPLYQDQTIIQNYWYQTNTTWNPIKNSINTKTKVRIGIGGSLQNQKLDNIGKSKHWHNIILILRIIRAKVKWLLWASWRFGYTRFLPQILSFKYMYLVLRISWKQGWNQGKGIIPNLRWITYDFCWKP